MIFRMQNTYSVGCWPKKVFFSYVVVELVVVELVVELVLMGGLSAPPGAYGVELSGRLVGTGVDQVQYRFLPERSQEGRLVLELQGPDPDEVWTYFSAPTELTVKTRRIPAELFPRQAGRNEGN